METLLALTLFSSAVAGTMELYLQVSRKLSAQIQREHLLSGVYRLFAEFEEGVAVAGGFQIYPSRKEFETSPQRGAEAGDFLVLELGANHSLCLEWAQGLLSVSETGIGATAAGTFATHAMQDGGAVFAFVDGVVTMQIAVETGTEKFHFKTAARAGGAR